MGTGRTPTLLNRTVSRQTSAMSKLRSKATSKPSSNGTSGVTRGVYFRCTMSDTQLLRSVAPSFDVISVGNIGSRRVPQRPLDSMR